MEDPRLAQMQVLVAVGVERFLVADSDLPRHEGLARIIREVFRELSAGESQPSQPAVRLHRPTCGARPDGNEGDAAS